MCRVTSLPAPYDLPMSHRTVWVVLPAYNEEDALGELLDRIDESLTEEGLAYQVVVVDDGSSDRTYDIALRASETRPVIVERHPVNQGLGATVRDGMLAVCEKGGDRDILVTLDADNTHTPGLIARMVRMIREGHHVVIASRYRPGSRVRGVPVLRKILSRGASMLMITLFPIQGVRDYTCGFRAYDLGALKRAVATGGPGFFDQDGFQVMVDILLKLRKEPDLIFGEVPLILRYDQKVGESKMDIGATVRKTFRLIVKHRFGLGS
jgi:dolichol-phosphate mannosyltransferase